MRRSNSLFNILTGIVSQTILILLGFISRKIFVNILGLETLGINGLFSSIISMLSLVELGIGGAIYYSLYKPLAQNNYGQIHATMQLYSKLYKYIALAVAIIGVALLPFLQIFIKEHIDVTYLRIVFLIFVIDAVLSYLLAYKKNIISASQKTYVINTVQTIFSIAISIVQIIIIIMTKNFVLFLLVKVILGLSSNILFYYIANRMYPYLKSKDKVTLNPDTKTEIIKNAKALFMVNIAVYCVFGTTNILISIFVNVTTVGIYSNYLLIINTINRFVDQIFSGIRASFGDFLIKESIDDAHEIFDVSYFLNFWVIGFCSVCLIVLLNPFITIWLRKTTLFPLAAVIIIIANFYSRGMTAAIETVRNSAGLYSPYPFFKYWALVEGFLNLAIGIILAGWFKLGIFGIFLATTISTQITVFVLPWNVYKYVFKRPSKAYYKKNIIYLACTVLFTTVTFWLCSLVKVNNGLILLIIKGIICVIVPNVFIIAFYHKTPEFQYILKIRKSLIKELVFKKKKTTVVGKETTGAGVARS